uniref:Uncharacterized protein n=1 Tax=Octopus bimaculoides TaxID=37653 RepID=A0A0L8IF35_OCTBM
MAHTFDFCARSLTYIMLTMTIHQSSHYMDLYCLSARQSKTAKIYRPLLLSNNSRCLCTFICNPVRKFKPCGQGHTRYVPELMWNTKLCTVSALAHAISFHRAWRENCI